MEIPGETDDGKVLSIIEAHGTDLKNLIPILQAVQEEYGYLPSFAISTIAGRLQISEDVIFGVATFYTHFKFTKPGKHTIKACLGTACYVKGAENLLELIKDKLGIEPGQTTQNGEITLERVACLGCCALAPTIVIDEEVYGKVTTNMLSTLLDEIVADKDRGDL
ncbi:MAG TPA: NADH-quinone oxidoreductase subunit NuoE [Euryarchaeota archaeon]|nr:NADH-quinone oxidoreductase subunit NuoE [Euryarchaeota archaeon]